MRLTRCNTSDQGTFGILVHPDFPKLHLFTGELPDHSNQQSISCIPVGTYGCVMVESPTKGHVYEVVNVPNRTHILIHIGNYCGDKACGFRTDSYGCILPGMEFGRLGNQKIIGNSKVALDVLHRTLDGKPFELEIVEQYAC